MGPALPLGRRPTASPRPWPMPWPRPRPLPTRFAPGPRLASCSSDVPRHAQWPAHHRTLRSSCAHAARFTTSWVFLVLNIPLRHFHPHRHYSRAGPASSPHAAVFGPGAARFYVLHATLPVPFAHPAALTPLHAPVLACTRSLPHHLRRPSHCPALPTRHGASISQAIRNSRWATRLSLSPGPSCCTHARPAGSPRFPGHTSPAHGPNDARTDSRAHPASFALTPAPITAPSQTAHASGGSSATHRARVTPIPCGPSLGLNATCQPRTMYPWFSRCLCPWPRPPGYMPQLACLCHPWRPPSRRRPSRCPVWSMHSGLGQIGRAHV